MFIGHFGVAFAAKKINDGPSLGTCFMAAQFIDLLWPFFLLAGLEKVRIEPGNTAFTPLNFIYYPFSHSLFSVLIWGFLFGLFYYFIKKNRKSAILLGLLVISHWFLDLVVHRPDLPLAPWLDIKSGMGLWNYPHFTVLIESVIFFTGIYFYVSGRKPASKMAGPVLWSFVVFLLLIYVMNIFSEPPPSPDAIGMVGISQWLLVAWGYWIDKKYMRA
jgi:membrane-bound metal-dependent hydrolase YbcI (DUF457 family)